MSEKLYAIKRPNRGLYGGYIVSLFRTHGAAIDFLNDIGDAEAFLVAGWRIVEVEVKEVAR